MENDMRKIVQDAFKVGELYAQFVINDSVDKDVVNKFYSDNYIISEAKYPTSVGVFLLNYIL